MVVSLRLLNWLLELDFRSILQTRVTEEKGVDFFGFVNAFSFGIVEVITPRRKDSIEGYFDS